MDSSGLSDIGGKFFYFDYLAIEWRVKVGEN